MERIKTLLEHIIASAKIRELDDIELVARVLLSSIETDCVDNLADKCMEFTEEQVEKIEMIKRIQKQIELN